MNSPGQQRGLTLVELMGRVRAAVTGVAASGVWVRAQLNDVRVSGGHCYMELLQKDDGGQVLAKCRAAIWANVFRGVSAKFKQATGVDFATGLEVLLLVRPDFHVVYGMSLVVGDVDPSYTMGDLERRRRESIERLRREGVLEMNRTLTMPELPLRVAVISAPGAAGLGDFANQLAANRNRLPFVTRLFPARMQGDNAPASIINALWEVQQHSEDYDCVVLIRGGGASSDLLAFDDYNLASAVAQCELPVIIGIGHERDVTLLDYVAHMRVKTPTAAAEWLISRGELVLERLRNLGTEIQRIATRRTTAAGEFLAHVATALAMLPHRSVERCRARLLQSATALQGVATRRVAGIDARLDTLAQLLVAAAPAVVRLRRERLEAVGHLIEAYSPGATLRRGYSITRLPDGTTLRNVSQAAGGADIITTVADGIITSTIK